MKLLPTYVKYNKPCMCKTWIASSLIFASLISNKHDMKNIVGFSQGGLLIFCQKTTPNSLSRMEMVLENTIRWVYNSSNIIMKIFPDLNYWNVCRNQLISVEFINLKICLMIFEMVISTIWNNMLNKCIGHLDV